MGVVYRARDTRDGRVVALKVLGELADLELLARFEREATSLQGLRHPNLVEVLELRLAPPTPFIALEYVPGETLLARVTREGPLPWQLAVRLVSEVAAGLSAAHERGLLHRDVKPANVLLGPAGAKLADFGLVKQLGRDSLTQSGATLGTANFMAPEQIGNDTPRMGPATDVYGLAATLFFALTGRPPFEGSNVVATLTAVVRDPPPSPRGLAADVPAWLDALCLRGLAKTPLERFPSAIAFRAALQHGAQSPAPFRPWIPLAAILGGALAVTLGWALRGEQVAPPTPQVRDAPAPPPAPSPDPTRVEEVHARLDALTLETPAQVGELVRLARLGFVLVDELPEDLRPLDRERLTQGLTRRLREVGPARFRELGWARVHQLLSERLEVLPWAAVHAHLLTLDGLEPGLVPPESLVAWGDRVEWVLQREALHLDAMLPLARIRLRQDPVDAERATRWLNEFGKRATSPRERLAVGRLAYEGQLYRLAILPLIRAAEDPELFEDPELWTLLRHAHHAVGLAGAWLDAVRALRKTRPDLQRPVLEEVATLILLRSWGVAEAQLKRFERSHGKGGEVSRLRDAIRDGRAGDYGDLDLIPDLGAESSARARALIERGDFDGLVGVLRDALSSPRQGSRDQVEALLARAEFEQRLLRRPFANVSRELLDLGNQPVPAWEAIHERLSGALAAGEAAFSPQEWRWAAQTVYRAALAPLLPQGRLADPGAVEVLEVVLESQPAPEPCLVRSLALRLTTPDPKRAVPGRLHRRLADLAEAALRPEAPTYSMDLRRVAELRLSQDPPDVHLALGLLRTLAQASGVPVASPVRGEAADLAASLGQDLLAERLKSGVSWGPLPPLVAPPRRE